MHVDTGALRGNTLVYGPSSRSALWRRTNRAHCNDCSVY